MSQFIATGEFQYLVDNVERAMIDQVVNKQPSEIRSLYKDVAWTPTDGNKVTFNTIARQTFQGGAIAEDEAYPVTKPIAGHELSKIQEQYGQAVSISRYLQQFSRRNLEGKMEEGRAIIDALYNQLDLELTGQLFSEADATTMTTTRGKVMNIAGADGVPIASASHVVNGATATWSNIATAAALSETSLTDAIEHGENNTVDDFGTNQKPKFNTIVIPQNQKMLRAIRSIFNSELRPDTSSTRGNNANIYYIDGGWKVVMLKWGDTLVNTATSSADNRYRWMIMDSEMAQSNFQLQVASDPTTELITKSSVNASTSILATQFAAFAGIRAQGTVYNLTTTAP